MPALHQTHEIPKHFREKLDQPDKIPHTFVKILISLTKFPTLSWKCWSVWQNSEHFRESVDLSDEIPRTFAKILVCLKKFRTISWKSWSV
jgi:hypothetical protein